jgi:hypothetical protein
MRRVYFAIALLFGPLLPAAAQDDWHPYSNPRFGYTVEIPPGFEMHQQADNNDGASFHADDNGATLMVFGTHPPAGDFETDVADRIGYERDDDWRILYSRVTPAWASFSGARGREVFYTRAIALCDGSAAYCLFPAAVSQIEADELRRRHLAHGCGAAPLGQLPGS